MSDMPATRASESVPVKLTNTQQELYDALKSGVVCLFMPAVGRYNPTAYYFRNDNMKRCTAAARALRDKGMAEQFDMEKYSGEHKLRVATTNQVPLSRDVRP